MALTPQLLQKIDTFQQKKKQRQVSRNIRDALQIDLDATKALIQTLTVEIDTLEAEIIAEVKALP
jgi:metal-responsive CopG/Arc/MetJ family transcriptional regulator